MLEIKVVIFYAELISFLFENYSIKTKFFLIYSLWHNTKEEY